MGAKTGHQARLCGCKLGGRISCRDVNKDTYWISSRQSFGKAHFTFDADNINSLWTVDERVCLRKTALSTQLVLSGQKGTLLPPPVDRLILFFCDHQRISENTLVDVEKQRDVRLG